MLRPLLLTLFTAMVASCTPGCPSSAESNPASFSERTQYTTLDVVQVVAGLEHPWAVAMLPDGGYLVTERPGRLLRIDRNGRRQNIANVPSVGARGQGGLLDVVLHPQFNDNQLVYMTFSRPADEGSHTATALARGRLVEDRLEDVRTLFTQDRYSAPGRHYGSRLAWMRDGTLLMTIGDRGRQPMRAQDTGDHAGTVLRLTEDGGVPPDNPFVDDDSVLDEIYSYGHRNAQGLVVAPDGTIWLTEHGPRGGDLVHRVQPGLNYGWPIVTQGLDYRTQEEIPEFQGTSAEGIAPPFHDFGPTLAPSGLAFITSDRVPQWQGNLLAGGLRGERIRRLTVDEHRVRHDEELLLQRIGRIRDVREAPDGTLYVLTDSTDGALYRITLR